MIMRLRYVEGAKDLIKAHPDLIINNVDNKMIDFRELFNNDSPIHVEIGMGKGKFIYELASKNPNINYVGIERFDSAIVKALEKVIEKPLKNLMLLRLDANYLQYLFKEESISRIYLTSHFIGSYTIWQFCMCIFCCVAIYYNSRQWILMFPDTFCD